MFPVLAPERRQPDGTQQLFKSHVLREPDGATVISMTSAPREQRRVASPKAQAMQRFHRERAPAGNSSNDGKGLQDELRIAMDYPCNTFNEPSLRAQMVTNQQGALSVDILASGCLVPDELLRLQAAVNAQITAYMVCKQQAHAFNASFFDCNRRMPSKQEQRAQPLFQRKSKVSSSPACCSCANGSAVSARAQGRHASLGGCGGGAQPASL